MKFKSFETFIIANKGNKLPVVSAIIQRNKSIVHRQLDKAMNKGRFDKCPKFKALSDEYSEIVRLERLAGVYGIT